MGVLKRNRQKPQTARQGKDQQSPAGTPASAPASESKPINPLRRWMYRGLLALVLPLLGLGIIEAALRCLGVGHPTSFLVRTESAGGPLLTDNPWFGLRFFPPALTRSPSPVRIEAKKPPGVVRIFLFGESAAMGDPRPAYGMGRYLEALLEKRFPERKFEVVCVAMTAINSHAILPIARECEGYQGDLWIIYAGNNEFVGPFGASTVFGPQAPPAWSVRAFLALETTRLGQVLVKAARGLHRSGSTPASWGGLKMFVEHQLPPGDARRERVYKNFKSNLGQILKTATRARIPVILSTVSSNLKDCAPFGSYRPPSAPADWQQWCSLAESNRAAQNLEGATANYQKATELCPGSAEIHFRLATALLETTHLDEARQNFEQARDLDTLPFRADGRINSIISAEAQRYSGRGVVLVASEKALGPLSTSGIAGSEAFFEHVHLNWDGNYRLALAFAQQAVQLLPKDITMRESSGWASAETCAKRLGLSDWNRYAIWEEILRRLADPPFTGQLNHGRQLELITNALNQIKNRAQRMDVRAARGQFETELQRHPGDHWLHHNFAEFLAGTGNPSEAIRQMQAACDLMPSHHAAYLELGRLLARHKKYDQAEASLRAALRLRPDIFDAHVDLGQVLAAQGKYGEALAQYDEAERLQAQDAARLYLLRADIFSQEHKRDQAIESLRHAVRMRPDYWDAHELLGITLALDSRFAEAQTEFEQVVRARPGYAEGHLNLGIALARQRHFPEALVQFQETLRLDPQNTTAQTFITSLKEGRVQPASP